MGVYDVESLTSLANLIAPYVSLVLASKHKKEVSSIDLVTDFTNLYSLPCYYWNRQTGVKRPVNVAISDVVSTVETAANEELIKIKEMAKDSAESADRADLAALLSALSAAESAATALDLKNQTIDYLNTVKDDEATRVANENIRLANELERKTNESERINKENIRRSNEDIRILNENDRIKNENERKSLEVTRLSNESLRLELELDRQDAETIRNSNENTRISNENTRKTQETNRLNKEAERQLSETDRINNENSRKSAEQSRVTAETNRVNAELDRVTAENNREELFNISKEAADLAADRANDVASHLPYIGEDLYWYLYDESTKSYNKTTKYSKGDNFSVKATFSSIAEMEAYVNPSVETASNPILKIGDFIVIATDVELEDNAKLYVVSNVTSTKITFDYIADFSGARGFTGHTPLLSIGTITTGSAGTAASVSLTEDGIDANGNPKYKINFTIPKGDKGEPFTYDDFTEELITNLLKPATDAAAIANGAAENANTAATNANDKASLANAAALAANTAASNADLATANAIKATAGAKTAANNANQAATNANNAASNANSAADNANNAVANLNWENLSGKPSTFTPSEHNHVISEITDISSASVNYATTAKNINGGYCSLANESSDWNFSVSSNRIIPIVSDAPAVPGAPGGYYGGLSVVTRYVGFQLATYGGSDEDLKFRKLGDDGTWYIWRNCIHSGNYSRYALPLSGGEMSNGSFIKNLEAIVFESSDDGYYVGRASSGAPPYRGLLLFTYKNTPITFYTGNTERMRILANGYIGIGTSTPDYILTVNGSLACTSLIQTSDIRKKNVINDTKLLIDDIANAPLFTYTFKDSSDKDIHVGTSAQYWEGVNSGLFTSVDSEGAYGLEIPNLALCSAISIAKQFREYKEQTDAKIEDLLNQINELKELINTLK